MSTTHSDDLNPLEGALTVFFVSKILSTSGTPFNFSKGNNNSSTIGYSYVTGSIRSLGNGGSNTQTTVTAIPDTTPRIITFTFSGSEATYYANNSLISSSSYSGSINSTNDFTIGSRAGGTSNSNVQIYELIIFKRKLKSNEIDGINKYLGKKWGIIVS